MTLTIVGVAQEWRTTLLDLLQDGNGNPYKQIRLPLYLHAGLNLVVDLPEWTFETFQVLFWSWAQIKDHNSTLSPH
jgi:hypothetical protein